MATFTAKRVLFALCASLWLSKQAWATSSHNTSHYDYGFSTSEIIKRQSSQQFSPSATVTGVHTGTGPGGTVPLRPNILDMENDSDHWTLYILALDMMQFTDQTQLFSWYQISGIHGRPFVQWDGVQGNYQNGYCTHVSILFPIWHRPYLALYEQLLSNLANQIANMWAAGPTRDRYVAAAQTFRIPYWDWAAELPSGQSILPASLQNPSITINGPSGTQTISNPLFSYRFNPLIPNDLPNAPFNVYGTTERNPTTSNSAAVSQDRLVANILDGNTASFRSRLYNLFTNYPNYQKFSNEAWIGTNSGDSYESIESLHDTVHGLSGSGGHMTYIEYSAFDPLFYLHHAMVDRVFDMWQALYPNSYVTPQVTQYGTFTNAPGSTEDINTPLTPFHSDNNGNFWTAATAKSTLTFGYSYAETVDNTDAASIQGRVRTAVNTLYGGNAAQSSRVAANSLKTNSTGPSRKRQDGLLVTRDPEQDVERDAADTSSPAATGHYREWIANIRVNKHALSGPFYIHIFLGNFSSNPADWCTDPNNVATYATFAHLSMTNETNRPVSGTVPLTSALSTKFIQGSLSSLDSADVVPYLQENLQYTISRVDGTAVPMEDVPSLVIEVASSVVQPPSSMGAFPVWGRFQTALNSSIASHLPWRMVDNLLENLHFPNI